MAVERISNDDISNYFEKQNFNTQVIEAISYLKDLSDGFEDELLSRKKLPKRFVMLDESTVGERLVQSKMLETYDKKPDNKNFPDERTFENERLELLKNKAVVDDAGEYEEIEIEEPVDDEECEDVNAFALKEDKFENESGFFDEEQMDNEEGEEEGVNNFIPPKDEFEDVDGFFDEENIVDKEPKRDGNFALKMSKGEDFTETQGEEIINDEDVENEVDFALKEDDLEDLDDVDIENYDIDGVTKTQSLSGSETTESEQKINEKNKKVKSANCTTDGNFNTYHKIEDFDADVNEKENLEAYSSDEIITENPIKEFRFKIDQQAKNSESSTLENINKNERVLEDVSKLDISNIDFSSCEFSSIDKSKRVVSTFVKRTTYELAGLGKLEPKKWKHLNNASMMTLEKFREMPSIEEFKKVQHAFGKTEVNEIVSDYQRIVSRFINGGEAVLKKSIDELKNELKLLQKTAKKN